MRIDYFRITDIAKRMEIPEDTVRDYARIFDDFLLWWDDGTQRLYTPDALLILSRIDRYVKEGKTPEEVKAALNEEFPQLLKQKEERPETECPGDEQGERAS
jgi:DNA-binding transcriptional MerR regulator